MKNRVTQRVMVAGVGRVIASFVIGIGVQQLSAQSQQVPPSAFEVASVKPFKGDYRELRLLPAFLPGGRFIFKAPLVIMIGAAYDVPFSGLGTRIIGAPSWINIDSAEGVYDIEAMSAKGSFPDGMSANDRATRWRPMLQALLAERFKLVIRHEAKEMPVYALVVGKNGSKLQKADIEEKDCPESAASVPADSDSVCHQFSGGRGRGLHARAVDMSDLINFVQTWTDRPLVDMTGIKGLYHIDTEPWQPMQPSASGTKADGQDVGDVPTLFTVFERLGLKMEPQKGTIDVYVIDHVAKPTEN